MVSLMSNCIDAPFGMKILMKMVLVTLRRNARMHSSFESVADNDDDTNDSNFPAQWKYR